MGARSALVAILLLSLACGGGVDTAPAEPSPATVSDDLTALRARLALPDGATGARWSTTTLGAANPSVPGPTDVRLTAWVEIDPARWDSVDALYGDPRPARGPLQLSSEDATLLPGDLPDPLPQDLEYRPDRAAKVGWRVSTIRRVGDAGLWIVAISS